MPDLLTIEQRFWAKVWRCTHRGTCRKCCWPWRSVDVSFNWKCVWQRHAVFSDKDLLSLSPIPAHRFAYELCRGALSFRGRCFHMCHQCFFGPCCNPTHISAGSPYDNAMDRSRSKDDRLIYLPDGRQWSYKEACQSQACFQEAYAYKRVWAGEIPNHLEYMLDEMNRGDKDWKRRLT